MGQQIYNRKNNEREPNDFYVTPPETTRALMEREKFDGLIWECACGTGEMAEVIKEYDCMVFSSDLIDRGYGRGGVDFLQHPDEDEVENIITNPPYKHAFAFVKKAKKIATKKIAMLLKITFLEGISRYEMFQDTDFPLKIVYVFCRRQKVAKEGMELKNAGMIAYAWFVWDKEYKGKPIIEWIP